MQCMFRTSFLRSAGWRVLLLLACACSFGLCSYADEDSVFAVLEVNTSNVYVQGNRQWSSNSEVRLLAGDEVTITRCVVEIELVPVNLGPYTFTASGYCQIYDQANDDDVTGRFSASRTESDENIVQPSLSTTLYGGNSDYGRIYRFYFNGRFDSVTVSSGEYYDMHVKATFYKAGGGGDDSGDDDDDGGDDPPAGDDDDDGGDDPPAGDDDDDDGGGDGGDGENPNPTTQYVEFDRPVEVYNPNLTFDNGESGSGSVGGTPHGLLTSDTTTHTLLYNISEYLSVPENTTISPVTGTEMNSNFQNSVPSEDDILDDSQYSGLSNNLQNVVGLYAPDDSHTGFPIMIIPAFLTSSGVDQPVYLPSFSQLWQTLANAYYRLPDIFSTLVYILLLLFALGFLFYIIRRFNAA